MICLLVAGCNGADEVDDTPTIETPTADSAGSDHWIKTFGPYLSEEWKAAYLATPEADRFEVYGERLLDFHRREVILEGARVNLTKAELQRFYGLSDAEACRAYVGELEARPGRVTAPEPDPEPPS